VVVLSLIGVCSFNGDELFGDEDKKDSNDKKNWGDDDVKKAGFPKTAFEYAKMCESDRVTQTGPVLSLVWTWNRGKESN